MRLRAGERLKAIRELMGLTREEFANLLSLDMIRISNIEQKRAKVAEEEFEKVGQRFPELIPYLAYEGDIVLADLKASDEKLCALVAAKIEAGQIPRGFHLEENLK
ncbi:helix-turn-helix domain-containing protein [Microbulbifer sp. 2304DJ12-6]|uniref:helix-turn-helix domain-containing protein n=1 Tax=Microbulbifer sp. 2304DJ12-6 TaxID=3233340 RepID=UPI0039B108B1